MKRKRLAALLLALLLLCGCAAVPDSGDDSGGNGGAQDDLDPTAPTKLLLTDPDTLLKTMTVRQKVGQLFIIRPDSLDLSQSPQQVNDWAEDGVTALDDSMAQVLTEYPAGGIAMFAKNMTDERQLQDFINELQNAALLPLLMAVDEEGGLVARLANHPAFDLHQYDSAAAVGASGNAAAALSMGSTIGAYLHHYGFNMNFAPVADVNTNPDNPIIGERAFSSDAATAAKMANAAADGLQQQGIIPVFKHFPGHGDTAEDSHSGIAVSYKTKEELADCEWLPYGELTQRDCVMVGHIAMPELTGDLIPATMSYEVVTAILRGELGFSGVVITDALAMGAVTDNYGVGEAAVCAIEAGCDIILCPQDYRAAFDALVQAVESGRISDARLDESVRRVLALKIAYDLD